MTGLNTNYQYIGEIPALGGVQLKMLANSYEILEQDTLDVFFPDRNINERTITVETIKYGIGTAPLVQPGVPAGNFLGNERIERRTFEPVYIREDDFVDQYTINQLREIGTINEVTPATEFIARRVQRLVNRQSATKKLLKALVLRGGVNYVDARTKVGINVSTNIPLHNFFRYDGWNAVLAAGGTAGNYTAAKNLINNKARPEALFFTDSANRIAVPWTNPNADIVRCLRMIRRYLANTNKNYMTDIVMSRDLLTVIMENNYIKTYNGTMGIFHTAPTTGYLESAGGTGGKASPGYVTFDAAGDLTSIAGLKITFVDDLLPDPETGKLSKIWPANQVALVARTHFQDRGQSLGFCHHPVGESPDQQPGLWMRVGPDQQPPAVPGRAMQLGNAFLPFAVYPQWISVVTVCEDADLELGTFFRTDIEYGTYAQQ
jgi:hypothetical protein